MTEQISSIPGLWGGLWHGFSASWTCARNIVSGMRIPIYEVSNSGNWYDVGFVTGMGIYALLNVVVLFFLLALVLRG